MKPITRFLIFIGTVLGVWLLLHLYVGWRLWSLPMLAGRSGRRALMIGLAVGWAAYPLGRVLVSRGAAMLGTVVEYGGAVWMGFIVLLVCCLAFVDIVTVFGLVLESWVVGLRSVAAGCAVVLAIVAWVGGQIAPRTVDLDVEIADLPRDADGIVIVQVSDLHLGNLAGARFLRSVIRRVDGLGPDLVAVTGDVVDSDAGALEELLPALSELTARRGVYAVLGNHEHYAGADRCRRLFRQAGFTVLDDAASEVVPGLWIAGVDDRAAARQTGGEGGKDEDVLARVPQGSAIVLLQHTPGNEEMASAAGVDLMLNGHTHGAQIWPFHYLVRRSFPHLAGVRTVGGMTQVVSRGAGRWGPPMRLGAPSEIYRITLRAPRDGT